jgi:hypothetical protein
LQGWGKEERGREQLNFSVSFLFLFSSKCGEYKKLITKVSSEFGNFTP